MYKLQPTILKDILDCAPKQPELIDAILFGRAEIMRASVLGELEKYEENVQREKLLNLFNQLPEAHRVRLLVSPETGEWLADRQIAREEGKSVTGPDFDTLYNMLLRETVIAALAAHKQIDKFLESELEEKVWSPIGDWSAQRTADGWVLEKLPTIGEVCSVDFESPLALRYEARSGTLSKRILEWEPGEKELVVEKLNTAISKIDEVQPGLGALIRNFTRRIMIRKSVNRKATSTDSGSRTAGSEHVTRQPGSIRLLNVHMEEVTIAQCMESLLHESIHNFLAAWETIHGRFARPNEKVRPISPWSGNPIPNSSFIHAIFVYYACHLLFATALTKVNELDLDLASNEYIKKNLAKFGVGFLIDSDLSDLLVANQTIDQSLCMAINEIQLSIVAFYTNKGKHFLAKLRGYAA